MAKRGLLAPRVRPSGERLGDELLARYTDKYLPDLSDAVGPLYTMDGAIRPLHHGQRRVIGQALTVRCLPGDNLTVHLALRMVQDGDVLVIDAHGDRTFCGTGAGSLVLPTRRGLRGIVTDGVWRDLTETESLGVPILARGVSPVSPPKNRIGEINVPISCGGVIVQPGDLIVADAEGTVVIPSAAAAYIADEVADYRPTGADDWPVEQLETQMSVAWQRFDQLLAEQTAAGRSDF